MTRTLCSRIALLVLLGAAGCGKIPFFGGGETGGGAADDGGAADGKADEGADDGADDGEPAVDVGGGGGEPVVAPSSNPARYIALMNDPTATCSPVDKWVGGPLFRSTSSAQKAWGTSKLPGTLQRFCVYTWGGGGAPGAAPVVPGAVRVDPDLDVVVPQGATPRSILEAHAETTLKALGAEVDTIGQWPYSTSTKGLPYVAVIDTADSRPPSTTGLPSYATAPPRHRHGLMMGTLIEAIRCPKHTPECISRQFFAQAFPYDASSATPLPSGGLRGSLGSLATALGESVARWRSLPDAASSPLVINMSLGWDLEHHPEASDPSALPSYLELLHETPNASVPATVQAVQHALILAACEGALSFAASGNARGAPCEQTGTMGPAAWEDLPAPDAAACSRLGVTLGRRTASPLVYAVGGLDASDQPIANTRRGSMPSRALYAHRAVVEVDTGGSGPTSYGEPWTGTSVATAGLSAIAAQAWSFRPGQSATALMSTIDSSGQAVPVDDRYQGSTADTPSSILRLDAHSVMNAVDQANNPYADRSSGGNTIGLAILGQGPVLTMLPQSSGPVTLTTLANTSTCDGVAVPILAAPGYSPLPSAAPPTDVLRPQPPVALCPNCPIVKKPPPKKEDDGSGSVGTVVQPAVPPEYELELELGDDYASANQGVVVDQPVLEFEDGSGTPLVVALGTITLSTARQVIDLSNYTFSSGQTQQSLSEWLEANGSVSSARLRLRVDDGSGTSQTSTEVISVVR